MAEFVKTKDGRYIADWLYPRYGTETFFPKDFLPFEEARDFIRKLKLKGTKEWREHVRSNNIPNNIPTSPHYTYKNKGWISWGDFLGTDFLPFKEARGFVRGLCLKNIEKWKEYSKSEKKPDNIPTAPYHVYKNKGWENWSDFLGTGKTICRNSLPFEEARKFVRNLKLKNYVEWRKYCTSDKKPNNIPADPRNAYKNKGWISSGDWLGTGYIAPQNRKFLSFKEAREFVRNLKLQGQREWHKYCKSGKRLNNVPTHPDRNYKNEWTSWGDWLGTGNLSPTNMSERFLSFEGAREFVRKLRIKSGSEWRVYSKSDKKPDDIPASPHSTYKDKGWTSWGDFLGTGRRIGNWLPFKEAKEFARKLKLKGNVEWYKYSKSGKKPDDIPVNPSATYKNKGWISWPDFLGTK